MKNIMLHYYNFAVDSEKKNVHYIRSTALNYPLKKYRKGRTSIIEYDRWDCSKTFQKDHTTHRT